MERFKFRIFVFKIKFHSNFRMEPTSSHDKFFYLSMIQENLIIKILIIHLNLSSKPHE